MPRDVNVSFPVFNNNSKKERPLKTKNVGKKTTCDFFSVCLLIIDWSKRCLNDYNICSCTHISRVFISLFTHGSHVEGVTGEVLDQHMIAEQTTVYHHPVYRVLLNMLMKNCSVTDSCNVVWFIYLLFFFFQFNPEFQHSKTRRCNRHS